MTQRRGCSGRAAVSILALTASSPPPHARWTIDRQQLQQEQWELVFEWPTGEQQQVKEPQHQIKQEGPEVKQEQPNVKEEQRKEVVVKREAVQQQQQEEDDGRRGAPDAEPAAKRQRRSLSPGADGGAAA